MVHVLDDGFQHLRLARDLDLLLAGDEEMDRPAVLPRGRLREPLDAARHADALLWTGPEPVAAMSAKGLGLGVAFEVRRTAGRLHSAPFGDARPSAGARIVAHRGHRQAWSVHRWFARRGVRGGGRADLAGSSSVHAAGTWNGCVQRSPRAARAGSSLPRRTWRGCCLPSVAIRGGVAAPEVTVNPRTRSTHGSAIASETPTPSGGAARGACTMWHPLELAAVYLVRGLIPRCRAVSSARAAGCSG